MFLIKAFVDQIHSGIATLLLGEHEEVTVQIPVTCLPVGITEGTVVRISMTIDQAATQASRDQVQTLLDELPNEP